MTQKYVVVWNRPSQQPLREEFLVLGGARQTAVNTTGIFHTGAKKAMVAAHLLSMQVSVVSEDDRGIYTYTIHHKSEAIGDRVLGVFGDLSGGVDKVVECTYTTAIADNAWIAPINGNRCVRLFAQFILNAVGTSPGRWGILQNQEEIVHVPGTTRVYIPQTPEILGIVENLNTYFSQGNIPLASITFKCRAAQEQELTVEIHRKPDTAGTDTIFYHTGTIAYWEEEPVNRPYRYAYNVSSDKLGALLSEERHIRSHSVMQLVIIAAYEQAIRNSNPQAIVCLLQALRAGEGQLGIWARSRLLGEKFHEMFGKRACITSEEMVAIVAAKLSRPVIGIYSPGLRYTLANSGVEVATDDAAIRGGRVKKPLGKKRTAKLERALDILQKAGLTAPFAIEYFGFTNISPDDDTAGVHEEHTDINLIGIRLDMFDDFEDVLRTVLHEHRHITSRAGDNTRAFTYQADMDLIRLALALYDGKEAKR